MSCTSPSRRNSSRIYQDLKTIRLNSIASLEAQQPRPILGETNQPIMVRCICLLNETFLSADHGVAQIP
jgi:hypothetical protein